jgi:hypothetical protein
MTIAAGDVPWQDLKHAFGSARDVPQVLTAVSQSHGRHLSKEMERLWERVLHQGSIYSASPPVVQALIPLAANATGGDRKLYYQLLAEFASSARQAVRDGRAIPCCRGGDPEHGRAILAHLLEARDQFAPDLESRDRSLRQLAAVLLCCSADAGREAVSLVRRRFEVESDRKARAELFRALTRVRERVEDWTAFLEASLERESDSALRFSLRHAQVFHHKNATDDDAVHGLTSLFLAECETGFGADTHRFFQALAWLDADRQFTALLVTLDRCSDRDVIREVAERLLRLAFRDERSGWENRTCCVLRDGASEAGVMNKLPSLATVLRGLLKVALLAMLWKLFPFLLRRRLRRQRYRIEYASLTGPKPEIPMPLTANQRRTLAALAAKPDAWIDQTNLWPLFDLPDTAGALRTFMG